MGNLPGSQPTAYLGIRETNPPELYYRNRAPTLTDYKIYHAGDIWIDDVGNEAYILIKRVGTAPVWTSLTGSSANAIISVTGNVGGAVGPDLLENIDLLGSAGITVTGVPGTNTLTITGSGADFTWNEVLIGAANMVANNGYVTNSVATISLTLPLTCPFGATMRIGGKGLGGWKILQNASQFIEFGLMNTTPGVTGGIASNNANDSLEVVCITADTDFLVLSSVGNFTIT